MSPAAHQRSAVGMTDDEIAAFLDGRHTMVLATLGRDGWPHLVAMWYGMFEGEPAFLTYRGSQKYRNLERDPRITCLVEDGEVYNELRGVQIRGRVEVVEDDAGRFEIARGVTERYQGPVEGEVAEERVLDGIRKRVALRVRVDEITSWDHAKLAALRK